MWLVARGRLAQRIVGGRRGADSDHLFRRDFRVFVDDQEFVFLQACTNLQQSDRAGQGHSGHGPAAHDVGVPTRFRDVAVFRAEFVPHGVGWSQQPGGG
ncbi:MAG: hypothetical protein IIC79_06845 [Chloroflexi bacterium]|nr:hypothetical protein [Chloroflexota bacterium]